MTERVVSKEREQVVILTDSYKITGEVHLITGTRLTDFMVESKEFIAVINARVMGRDGGTVLDADFLNVRRGDIQVIAPAEMVRERRVRQAGDSDGRD